MVVWIVSIAVGSSLLVGVILGKSGTMPSVYTTFVWSLEKVKVFLLIKFFKTAKYTFDL